ncbi:UvrB/UvrC motif-containing protein [Sporosarcina limicola]|uniref:Protein arginine kinase activator n=1 Tax=Sporosarcina limicola TaxID=34101 RepID=A0A927MKB9_9BACL|nr:UvrB/UvrC motif-containing protein [Sporosarcina limicola]MBE1553149.1 protein arginine kinase activator [Sporosarcina limicola]
MNCENCNKQPATVIITQESVGETAERHLCEKCAFQTQTFHFDLNQEPLSIQQFLSHWFGGADPFFTQQQTRENPLQGPECPSCGLTFQKFLDIGKFGCAACYEAFRDKLPHVLRKLHNGHSIHVGKIPVSFNELYAVKKKIEEIRIKMKDAVEAERFEEAAALRDEVNILKQSIAHGGEESHVD